MKQFHERQAVMSIGPILRLAVVAQVLIVAFDSASVANAGLVFSDGFEGPTLDAFWSKTENSGSIAFPGVLLVHSGAQSLQMSTFDTGVQKNVSLTHDFGAPIYGSVSVWVFDVGADQSSGNYLELGLGDSVGNLVADIRTQDYDLGPGIGNTYLAAVSSIGQLDTGVDRTQDWHQWVIDSTPTSINMFIDGQNVYSASADTPFSQVGLYMFGPGWRPALTTAWDDFSVLSNDVSSVPEPGSFTIFGIGLCVFLGARRIRRSMPW